jgi:hypothetical protein
MTKLTRSLKRTDSASRTVSNRTLTEIRESGWTALKDDFPPTYVPILMAFADHWNPVAGFYSGDRVQGKPEFYQHTASDDNQRLTVQPIAWKRCERVPHDYSRRNRELGKIVGGEEQHD